MALLPLVRNPEPDQVQELRSELDAFYRTVDGYFLDPVDHGGLHHLMDPLLDRLLASNETIRVLEYGCGKTTFARHLGSRRSRVHFIVQDVTPRNREYLAGCADEVVIGDIAEVRAPVHLAFSTFVLEHVASPAHHLSAIAALIPPGGSHVVFCPNYELPGYLCPSLRHLSRRKRVVVNAFLAASRLAALLDRQPRFWVNLDPAVRHVEWYRDADAVHVVSRRDLEWWHVQAGFDVTRLYEPRPSEFGAWKARALWDAIVTKLACTRRIA
jgi:hypothetical protein